MQSNNVQAVCPDTMPRAQMSPILASDAFHPSAFPMISTFCNGDHIFTKFQHDMHSAGDFKKTPMDSQNGSRVQRHPVRVRATSRSTHASHTPPSRTQKRIKHWLATPKASVNCWGARTCYSSPRAIVHSNSTSTYYTYRTCIYSKVHTCMYYITVIVHACYMAILHARTTTVPIPKLSNRERWNPKAACHKQREAQKGAWKRSKHPSRSLIAPPTPPRASFGASDRSRMWIFG